MQANNHIHKNESLKKLFNVQNLNLLTKRAFFESVTMPMAILGPGQDQLLGIPLVY